MTEKNSLLEAIQAHGAMPEGYCFCSQDRIGDDSKIHEPECRDLRLAIASAARQEPQLAHHGDPCFRCGVAHDDVEIGPCTESPTYCHVCGKPKLKATHGIIVNGKFICSKACNDTYASSMARTDLKPPAADYVAGLDSRTWWLLFILSKSGGQANASDERWDWINAFCEDRDNDDDTFNLAADDGLIRVSHNTDTDQSTAYLTDAGKAALAARPASPDTRVVPVNQLAKWQCMTWAIGDSATAAEIAAIIEGGQDRG